MTGLYHYPPIWLHRVNAGWKLLGLAGVSVVIAMLSGLIALTSAFGGVLAIYLLSGLRARLRLLAPLTPVFVILFAAQYIALDIGAATEAILRMGCMILFADLVTLSTKTHDMMDALAPLLAPFRLVGLKRETVAFAVAFTIRLVPLLLFLWMQQTEAYRARTGRRASWRLIAPYLAQLGRTADHMAEALDARGFGAGTPRAKRTS